jgi:tetratricopeptide (TPR) repeat protein
MYGNILRMTFPGVDSRLERCPERIPREMRHIRGLEKGCARVHFAWRRYISSVCQFIPTSSLREHMAGREEIVGLIAYVLGDKNRQRLVAEGLDGLPKETRIAALRGLQDLGWIGHSGVADFEESYTLTKDGRMIFSEHPSVSRLENRAKMHVDALRLLDGEEVRDRKDGLKRLITIDCDLGNWDSALMHCYQLKKLAEQTEDIPMMAFALLHQGKVEMVQNRWDEALESFLNANERSVECGDTKGVSMSNRAMGVIYANKGDHASAIRCFESSLSMAKMAGDKDLEAKAEGNLANIYDLEGRFAEAEAAHEKCLAHFLESGDTASAARTANNLGVLGMFREDYPAAAEHFEKAIELSKKAKNREVLGISMVNGGYCQLQVGDLAKAIEYTDESMAIFREEDDKHRIALAYRNYGAIELRNSKFESAFDWFEKSVRAAKASGVEDTIAECYHEYGMSLIKTVTDMRLGRKLLKRSADMYRNMGNFDRAKSIENSVASV